MNYIIWNKQDKINGIEAQYFIDDLKINETDGVFLIGDDLNDIQAIEIDRIIKNVYDLDKTLTTEEVAKEYVRIREEEKLQQTKARSAEKLKVEQMSNIENCIITMLEEIKSLKEVICKHMENK